MELWARYLEGDPGATVGERLREHVALEVRRVRAASLKYFNKGMELRDGELATGIYFKGVERLMCGYNQRHVTVRQYARILRGWIGVAPDLALPEAHSSFGEQHSFFPRVSSQMIGRIWRV